MSRLLSVTVAALVISAGSAFAQCADDQATGSISKDGSIAPLEAEAETDGASTDEVAKDGSEMPLEENADQAMSSDDVAAQQQGDDTAAAAAEDCDEDDAG
jgi:hypothetical protein